MDIDLEFVDSISASAAVRLDLTASPWAVQASTEFGTPEIRRAVAATLLTDGERYPAAAYGNRVIRLVSQIQAASGDAVATAMQALHRELERACNILRYRPPGATAPVYFRTFRCGPDSVIWSPELKQLTALIPAEPFALGLKETVGPTSVSNDPASANGMYLDLPTIKGDVETPLRVSMPVTDSLTADGRATVLAVRRRGTPSAAPFLLQAEAMSPINDTTTQPNSATMSGSGNNFVRTTFATSAARANRLTSFEWPAASSVDTRGRYRVFAAVKKSVADDAIDVWLKWGRPGSAATYSSDAVRLAATTNRHLIDLGLMSYPIGPDPVSDGLSGADLPVRGQSLAVDVARVSGSGTLDIDYLLFVPADDRMTIVGWHSLVVDGTETAVIDGTTEQVYGLTSTGAVFAAGGSSTVVGGWPAATPGAANRLHLLRSVGVADAVTNTTPVTVEYWPRYLYARPVSS